MESHASFFAHLNELRGRLITCFAAWIAGALIFYNLADTVLSFMIRPVGHLVFTSPSEAFTARMNLTLLGGFFLSLPVIFYQIWQFVALGLTADEKKYVGIFVPFSVISFLLGLIFAYFIMIPMSLNFLMGFSRDWIVPMITMDKYISFAGSLALGSGVIFELPLILFFLTKIGIATPEFLRQKRKYAIVIILIISAVLTPPDVISQILMAGPLLLLYEVGILVSQITLKQK